MPLPRASDRRLAIDRHAAIREKCGAIEACGVRLSHDGILAVHCGEVAEPGLRRTPGERVFSKGNRGFKSPPLRQPVSEWAHSPSSGSRLAAVVGFLAAKGQPERQPKGADTARFANSSPLAHSCSLLLGCGADQFAERLCRWAAPFESQFRPDKCFNV